MIERVCEYDTNTDCGVVDVIYFRQVTRATNRRHAVSFLGRYSPDIRARARAIRSYYILFRSARNNENAV